MSSYGMAFLPTHFMRQTPHNEDHHHDHSHPLSILNPIQPDHDHFHGVASFLGKRTVSFSDPLGGEQEAKHNIINGEEDLSDDIESSQAGDQKKRRLNVEQVKTLEKNFELGNKLHPERKLQLARALGLQPRQIAIWFQNRRARWKTKQLEKDYEVLKMQLDATKAHNESLLNQNQKLQAEIMSLKSKDYPTGSINLNKETDGCCSNRSESSSEINKAAIDSPLSSSNPAALMSKTLFPICSIRSPPRVHVVTQLFHDHHHLQNQTCSNNNYDSNIHHDQTGKEGSLGNFIFSGNVEYQPGFWPWLDHHHHHHHHQQQHFT